MVENVAIIQNGVVTNCIVINAGDYAFMDLIPEQWDKWVPIDGLDPRPGPQWLYDYATETFSPPPPIEVIL